tara:strand:+ start:1378 stop:1653 length:276 start_codon:yes stop_codon:yes gene_type:complete
MTAVLNVLFPLHNASVTSQKIKFAEPLAMTRLSSHLEELIAMISDARFTDTSAVPSTSPVVLITIQRRKIKKKKKKKKTEKHPGTGQIGRK